MCVKSYSVAAGTMVAALLKYKAVNDNFHLALDQKKRRRILCIGTIIKN
jgi:hypothetical protein